MLERIQYHFSIVVPIQILSNNVYLPAMRKGKLITFVVDRSVATQIKPTQIYADHSTNEKWECIYVLSLYRRRRGYYLAE